MGCRIQSSYHDIIYNPEYLFKAAERTIAKAREIHQQAPYDAFAFRGSSGAAMAFPLSITLKIPCIYVRKPEEKSHGKPIEGPSNEINSYLIIDDFIEQGKTINAIREALADLKCVGALLYGRTTLSLQHKHECFTKPIPLWGVT